MITCKFCGKVTQTIHHQIRCPKNPSRKGISTTPLTDSQRDELRKRAVRINEKLWDIEGRKKHSEIMRRVVENNPDSYSKNNVSGRVKTYSVMSSCGETKVKGSWELAVANWLNEREIRWTNDIQPFSYYWNDAWHLYFPDFHLLDYSIIIEIKGYETARDRAKWESVGATKFIVIKEAEMANFSKIITESIAG